MFIVAVRFDLTNPVGVQCWSGKPGNIRLDRPPVDISLLRSETPLRAEYYDISPLAGCATNAGGTTWTSNPEVPGSNPGGSVL